VLAALIALSIGAACESGEACALAAYELEAKHAQQSLELYERACAMKYQPACAQLAILIASRQPVRAVALADEACKAMEPLGCAVKGLFYLATSEHEKALRFFALGCEGGLLAACGAPTTYEYEGPDKAPRFTTDRAALPKGKPWRVFKTTVPSDLAAIRFSPSAAPRRPSTR
jgi:TPR repeat protein